MFTKSNFGKWLEVASECLEQYGKKATLQKKINVYRVEIDFQTCALWRRNVVFKKNHGSCMWRKTTTARCPRPMTCFNDYLRFATIHIPQPTDLAWFIVLHPSGLSKHH